VKQLQYCFDFLAYWGADIIVIACNTLHTLLEYITISSSSTIIHLAHVTLQAAVLKKLKRVLILATSTTVLLGLYQNQEYVYQEKLLECLVPHACDQNLIDDIIAHILMGSLDNNYSIQLGNIIARYPVDGVILGCTELPLLCTQWPLHIKNSPVILDSLYIAAQYTVARSLSIIK
jgi:aspartate racemase